MRRERVLVYILSCIIEGKIWLYNLWEANEVSVPLFSVLNMHKPSFLQA